MMITKIQLAAMGRVDIPEETRADFYLYVDEFQNFATESFANILSEARKYRLNLILANQYVTQIQEEVRDAIFGNAGSIISFRVGAMDAEFLEKEFEPVFMMNDIVNLPKYQIYLKLMIDGIAGDAFSANVLPPIKIESDPETERKIINSSRERYTSKKEDVEEKIRRWSGMLSPEEREALTKTMVSTVPASAMASSRPAAARPAPAPAGRDRAPAPQVTIRDSRAPERPRPEVSAVKKSVPIPEKREERISPRPVTPASPPKEVVPQAKTSIKSEEQPGGVSEKTSISPKQYSVEEASLAVKSALVAETEKNTAPLPPLAPKRAPLIDLDRFEKTEQATLVTMTPAASAPAVVEEMPEERSEEKEEASVEKVLYQAVCATCGAEIEVPFKPDGSRPTFCKDCLRDYQRATAKARNEIEKQQGVPTAPVQRRAPGARTEDRRREERREEPSERVVVPRSYVSSEQPLSLAQTQHIEPKKFKALRKHPPVDLKEIRSLISTAQKSAVPSDEEA